MNVESYTRRFCILLKLTRPRQSIYKAIVTRFSGLSPIELVANCCDGYDFLCFLSFHLSFGLQNDFTKSAEIYKIPFAFDNKSISFNIGQREINTRVKQTKYISKCKINKINVLLLLLFLYNVKKQF